MKVIIVDDEILVRAGMRMVIPWESLGFTIAGESPSAEEGIRMAREIKPDLMLVDITMPGMNGLDMIKLLKEEIPSCRFIILSCHSEVEYLTSAIRIGVSDYIIKDSLNPEEITETLQKLADSFYHETDSEKESNSAKRTEDIFLEAEQNPTLLCRDFLQEIEGPRSTQNAFFSFVLQIRKCSDFSIAEKICEQIVNEYAIFSVHYHTGNKIVFFIVVKRDFYPQKLIAHRCVETLGQTFSIESSAGASECRYGDTTLKELLNQSFLAADMKWIKGWKTAHIYSVRQQENNRKELPAIRERYLTADCLYRMEAVKNYLQEVHDYIDAVSFISASDVLHTFADLAFFINSGLVKLGMEAGSFTQEEIPAGVSDWESFEKLYQVYETRISRLIDNIKAEATVPVIIEIKKYIMEHLECKILLQDIAQEVHLTRTYISSLFKKETGININDYITKEKLEYAKGLLLSGDSISSIVYKIGIQSESYFSKLFREEFHMTPSQFLKENKRK